MRDWIAVILVWIGVATVVLFTWNNAPNDMPKIYPNRYAATIICPNVAEDSMAYLQMKEFTRNDDGTLTLVYRCMNREY